MRKYLSLFFLILIMLTFSNNRVKANFIPYDLIKGTGTFAETTKRIQIELEFKTDVNIVKTDLVLKDSNGTNITIDEMIALNNVGGKATRFKLELTNALDKNETYSLIYKDAIILLDLDNQAPLISYTNKVKNDSSKYNEKEETYLVEQQTRNIFERLFKKEEKFNLENYIRLNVVDNRDGSLLDVTKINNLPNIYKTGTYEVNVQATDAWDNTSEKIFNFEVIKSSDKSDLYINISVVSGVLLIITFGIIIYKRKK